MVQTKAATNKAYYEAHKAELAVKKKAYRETHKVETAAYREAHKVERAEYYQAHKVETAATNKAYYKIHKVEKAEYYQSPARKKTYTLSSWKRSGIIHDDIDRLYELYLQTTQCDVCKCKFKDTCDRCMDHDHETNLFRQFLCQSCNRNDHWKVLKNNNLQ